MIPYLDPNAPASAASLNALFSALDSKLAALLSSKSPLWWSALINFYAYDSAGAGLGEFPRFYEAGAVGPTIFPARVFGAPYFFLGSTHPLSGAPRLEMWNEASTARLDDLPAAYDHSLFTAAVAAASVASASADKQVALLSGLLTTASRSNFLDGCLAVLRKDVSFGEATVACLATSQNYQRRQTWAQAELICEDITILTIPAAYDKFDFFRVHNLSDESLEVNFYGDSGLAHTLTVPAKDCRCVRRDNGTFTNGGRLFQVVLPGDPCFWSTIKADDDTTEMLSSHGANNAVNPSLSLRWIQWLNNTKRGILNPRTVGPSSTITEGLLANALLVGTHIDLDDATTHARTRIKFTGFSDLMTKLAAAGVTIDGDTLSKANTWFHSNGCNLTADVDTVRSLDASGFSLWEGLNAALKATLNSGRRIDTFDLLTNYSLTQEVHSLQPASVFADSDPAAVVTSSMTIAQFLEGKCFAAVDPNSAYSGIENVAVISHALGVSLAVDWVVPATLPISLSRLLTPANGWDFDGASFVQPLRFDLGPFMGLPNPLVDDPSRVGWSGYRSPRSYSAVRFFGSIMAPHWLANPIDDASNLALVSANGAPRAISYIDLRPTDILYPARSTYAGGCSVRLPVNTDGCLNADRPVAFGGDYVALNPSLSADHFNVLAAAVNSLEKVHPLTFRDIFSAANETFGLLGTTIRPATQFAAWLSGSSIEPYFDRMGITVYDESDLPGDWAHIKEWVKQRWADGISATASTTDGGTYNATDDEDGKFWKFPCTWSGFSGTITDTNPDPESNYYPGLIDLFGDDHFDASSYRFIKLSDVANWCSSLGIPFLRADAVVPLNLGEASATLGSSASGYIVAGPYTDEEAESYPKTIDGGVQVPIDKNWLFWTLGDADSDWVMSPGNYRLMGWSQAAPLSAGPSADGDPAYQYSIFDAFPLTIYVSGDPLDFFGVAMPTQDGWGLGDVHATRGVLPRQWGDASWKSIGIPVGWWDFNNGIYLSPINYSGWSYWGDVTPPGPVWTPSSEIILTGTPSAGLVIPPNDGEAHDLYLLVDQFVSV